MDPVLLLFILVIAAFLGKELITKIPSQLHTPLMSATNAISGITVVGAVVTTAVFAPGTLGMVLSFIAIVLATTMMVGGYMVTGRMLEMFRKKEDKD